MHICIYVYVCVYVHVYVCAQVCLEISCLPRRGPLFVLRAEPGGPGILPRLLPGFPSVVLIRATVVLMENGASF